MARYTYTAISRDGSPINGQIEALSPELALRQLTDAGHYPISATDATSHAGLAGKAPWLSLTRPPSAAQITLFSRELAMLLEAGLTLSQSMRMIEAETSNPRLQKLAAGIRSQIASGKSLHDALEASGPAFPPVYVGMVKAAKASGQLDTVLERIADAREREQKLRGKVISALLYPSLLVVTAIVAVLVIFILVVPRFKQMLAGTGSQLPSSTQTIIAISDFLTSHGTTLAAALLALAVLAAVLIRRPAVRRVVDRMLLHAPVIDGLLRTSLTVRFCRTLGILLASGVGLPTALGLTRDVVGNAEAAATIAQMGVALRQGSDLTEPLGRSRLFPSLVVSMMRVGEETGRLSGSALYLADMFESRLEVATQRLMTILEPVIIIAVSVFVASIIMSIMGAVLSLYDLTQ